MSFPHSHSTDTQPANTETYTEINWGWVL